MSGEPMYNQPYQLQPFGGVKAQVINCVDSTITLYYLPVNFSMLHVKYASTSSTSNAILLPTINASYDSQSQVFFAWWDIDAGFDGQAISLTWLYPRAVDNSSAYSYAAEPINGSLTDLVFTRGTTDTRRNLFFIIVATPRNGYFIRAVQDGSLLASITSANAKLTVTQVGQAFTLTNNVAVTAGTGTSVSGTSSYAVSAFAGVPIQLGNTLVNAGTVYYGINALGNATESSVIAIMFTQPGVLSNLYIELASAVAATTQTYTVRSGNAYSTLADSTLTCQLATSALTGSDTTHSVVVSAGDIATVKVVQAGTPDTMKAAISFLFKPSAV